MKIVIDENIAFGKEAFSNFGTVIIKNGREITNETLRDADALIVRSITRINRKLLEGSTIKFVGSATIGVDHVDLDYLREKNIDFANAPGCNSQAVAEYVFSAIFHLFKKNKLSIKNKSIGIVGAGNIGSKIVKLSKALGLSVFVNDPPLERKTGNPNFCSLQDALQADIITFHVPLTMHGKDKTYHLINENELKNIRPNQILINSSRGPVVNNTALLKRIAGNKDFSIILDVWENEPVINLELLKYVDIATPHIAGYSLEGKVNGTKMVYEAFCKHFNFKPDWEPPLPEIAKRKIITGNTASIDSILQTVFNHVYNIWNDDSSMRKLLKINKENAGKYFDNLRKNYKIRRELSNYTVVLNNPAIELIRTLENFDLKLEF